MSVLKKIPLLVLAFMQLVISIIYYFCQEKEVKKAIPKSNNKLLHTNAVDLAEKIRKKEITSEELVSAYIQRIKDVNSTINAVIEDRFKEALIEAKKVDEYLQNLDTSTIDLSKTKPLLGIPITIKESVAVKGLSFTGCSLTRKGIKADEDADVVKLLKDAGGIILLVSSTPEYCTAIETTNNIIGRSKNPYDTRRVTGGSSGGEGALLGAGASVIGIGTDIGGSIRIPSAFNGIYGHKPTSGIVPLGGSFPWCDDPRFSEYLLTGPMTRYVEDLKLTLKVIVGNNAKKLKLDEEVDLKNVNVFYMEDLLDNFGFLQVDKTIKTAIKEAVVYLNRSCKCHINETKFPEMDDTMDLAAIIFRLNNPPNAFTDSEIKYNPKKEFLKLLFGKTIFTFSMFLFSFLNYASVGSEEQLQSYIKRAAEIKEIFTKVLGNNSVFLYPTFPTEAFEHNHMCGNLSGGRFCAIANLFGCPATNVPIGLNKNGMPQGIQVIAGPYQDNLCLEVAKELDAYFGGWRPPY